MQVWHILCTNISFACPSCFSLLHMTECSGMRLMGLDWQDMCCDAGAA